MPKFLAGSHYNEEEISRHQKKYIYIYIGWSKSMATSLQPVKSWKKRQKLWRGALRMVERKSLPNLCRSDLETLWSHPLLPQNLPGHCYNPPTLTGAGQQWTIPTSMEHF